MVFVFLGNEAAIQTMMFCQHCTSRNIGVQHGSSSVAGESGKQVVVLKGQTTEMSYSKHGSSLIASIFWSQAQGTTTSEQICEM